MARIAGGQTVRENELPYMVQIGRGGDFHVCGGALIGERHVLTAAHCFNGFVDVPEEFSVTTGALNIDGTGGKNYTINKIIQHENYDSKLSDNDIAVIEVSENDNNIDWFYYYSAMKNLLNFIQLSIAVDLNDESTQSVKLPVSDVSAITTATMSGWGQMGKNKSFSSKLLKLPVTTLNPTFCQDYIHQYKNEIPMADITSTVLCGFTNANNGFGTCTVSINIYYTHSTSLYTFHAFYILKYYHLIIIRVTAVGLL